MQVSFIINWIASVVVIFSVCLGIIAGVVRGLKRQTVRIVTVFVSVVAAYILTKSVYPAAVSFAADIDVAAVMGSFGIQPENPEIVNHIDTELIKCILALPIALVVAPLLTIPVFFAFRFLTEILHKLICGAIGFKRGGSAVSRLCGGAVGALQGLLIAAVVLIPVAGIIKTADNAVRVAEEKYPECVNTGALADLEEAHLSAAANSPLISAFYTVGGFAYGNLTSVNVGGEKINVSESLDSAVCIFVNYGELANTDWNNITERDKQVLLAIEGEVEGNAYCATLVSGALRTVGGALGSGGIDLQLDEDVKGFVMQIASVLKSCERGNLGADLRTVLSIYFELSDSGVFANMEDGEALAAIFLKTDADGVTLFGRLNEILSQNERMSFIASELLELSMALILKESGIESSAAEVVMNVKDGLNDILQMEMSDYETEEAYRVAVGTKVEQILEDNDIGLSNTQTDIITVFVVEQMDKIEEVTNGDIAEFIVKYYDAYINGNLGDLIPEDTKIPEEFEDLIPDGIEIPDDLESLLP